MRGFLGEKRFLLFDEKKKASPTKRKRGENFAWGEDSDLFTGEEVGGGCLAGGVGRGVFLGGFFVGGLGGGIWVGGGLFGRTVGILPSVGRPRRFVWLKERKKKSWKGKT